MNHAEFINELSQYGILVKVECTGVYDYMLTVNSEHLSTTEYKPFGYFCGGAYAPVSIIKRDYDKDDIIQAIKAFADLQANHIKALKDQLTYWDIKDYLQQYPAKSKILQDGINRTVEILKEDFNNMLRWKQIRK